MLLISRVAHEQLRGWTLKIATLCLMYTIDLRNRESRWPVHAVGGGVAVTMEMHFEGVLAALVWMKSFERRI
jgi:hypothetical protein